MTDDLIDELQKDLNKLYRENTEWVKKYNRAIKENTTLLIENNKLRRENLELRDKLRKFEQNA